MAMTGYQNLSADGDNAIFDLLTRTIVTGLWTVYSWSNGTTYTNTSGAPLTTNPFTITTIANLNAWIIITAPNTARRWCFQRGATSNVWRVKRGKSVFSGGTPSNVQVPSSVDEMLLWGGGTDAVPTFAILFNATTRVQIGADAASPGGWHLTSFVAGGGVNSSRTIIMDDPLVANTYATEDADPYISRCLYVSTGLGETPASSWLGDYQTTTIVQGFILKRIQHGTGSAVNCTVGVISTYFINQSPNVNIGLDPYGGREARFPMIYVRFSTVAQPGCHGTSSLESFGLWTTTTRNTGDILQETIGGTRYYLRIDQSYLLWDSTVVVQ